MDMYNNANPLFIANSDNPGLVLVTHPLIGENYGSWRRVMILALTEQNKLGFADGSIAESPEGDPQHLAWLINVSIVAS
ncbi:receptor-like serine/threonine kinase [Trifolium pratense]|uniref:Receptor-like serine/threonine kinase n=1 Tax=Trifolium pratense TaxID=57577 RepID=A0A2K3PID6_TRIPR|nr:receptor-like serine/threonine kinase [Trifolium pratense]